jgi:pimeloyl-ACP methyl ester carboxylesterase
MPSVVARGVRFNVQRLGSGEPLLVFLHGLVFDNLSSWYFTVAAPLARRFSLLLYDLRGHGLSEQPPTGYSAEDMADDLAAILESLGEPRRPVLVGNSFGGLVALTFAHRHPEQARALVLVDGQIADRDYGPQMSATLGLEGEERDRKIEEMFGEWLERHLIDGELDRDAADMKTITERTRSRRRRPAEINVERLVHGTTIAADIERTPALAPEDLAAIRCPVLAVYGEGSELLEKSREVAAQLPDCRLVVLPEAAHFVLLHQRDRLAEEIAGFVDGLDA